MSERVNLSEVPGRPTMASSALPSVGRVHCLPLAGLTPEGFERLCVRLSKTHSDCDHASAFGVRGQNQDGIDLYLRKRSDGRYMVWQCKRYQYFTVGDLRRAIDRFIEGFQEEGAPVPVKQADELVLAVTADLTQRRLVEELEQQAQRLRSLGLRLVAKDIWALSDDLKQHPEIVADFFHPAMAEAFCPKLDAGVELTRCLSETQTLNRALLEGLSSSCDQNLDSIRDRWGEGGEEEALRRLTEFKNSTTWPSLRPDVRAKALRMEAGLRLNQGHRTQAEALFKESLALDSGPKSRPFQARLMATCGGAEAVLAFIGEPQSQDEWVLRWNSLLELGRPKEVTDEFTLHFSSGVFSGDFASVVTLAYLAERNVSQAERIVSGALRAKPRHHYSRFVSAMVDYCAGISPSFEAWGHLTWPVPPPPYVVRAETESIRRRSRAAAEFEALEEGRPVDEVRQCRAWRLACLALNQVNRSDLEPLVQGWLEADPTDVPILVWAHAFGMSFDRTPSVAALTAAMEAGTGSLDQLLALIALLSYEKGGTAISDLLIRHRDLFKREGREALWCLHRGNCLIREGKLDEARRFVLDIPSGREASRIRSTLQEMLARSTGDGVDHERLVVLQTEEYQESGSLFRCCLTWRGTGDFDEIAEHTERLIEMVGTANALEIAAEALLRTRRHRECLSLLEKHRSLFPGGDLPPFARQLAAECHRHLSDLPAAIAELERAVHAGGGPRALAQLFEFQLQKGDLHGSLATAKKLVLEPHIAPEYILAKIVPVARQCDPDLARQLVTGLLSDAEDLPSEAKAALVREGFRFGLEDLATPLLAQLAQKAVAGSGPVISLTLEEAVSFFAEQRREAEERWEEYWRGDHPIHALATLLNLPIARLFHEAPRQPVGTGRSAATPPILTRYAGDAQREPVPLPVELREIYLDITSLLLLDALDVLPALEATVERVHIGASLIRCLQRELELLSPLQPDRVEAMERVIGLLERRGLHCWRPTQQSGSALLPCEPWAKHLGEDLCARLLELEREGGILVGLLPLGSRQEIGRVFSLPRELGRCVVSARAIVIAMGDSGWLSSGAAADALSHLGRDFEGTGDSPGEAAVLLEGMAIHLDAHIAENLSRVGVLESLCERARVTVSEEEETRIRGEVELVRANLALRVRAGRLLQHLSNGTGSGKYVQHVADFATADEQRPDLGPLPALLFEAITSARGHGCPVCIDDRMVRRHQKVEDAPLCDTWDLLHWMAGRGTLSDGRLRAARTQMRAANLRYLPLTAFEILLYLRDAPIRDGTLCETPELAALRRYVAATLLDCSYLQGPVRSPSGEPHRREAFWPFHMQMAIGDALIRVWEDDEVTVEQAGGRADWIWNQLWFDDRMSVGSFAPCPQGYEPCRVLGNGLGTLFGMSMELPGGRGASPTRSRRRAFQEWLMHCGVLPLVADVQQLRDWVAEPLRQALVRVRDELNSLRANHGVEGSEPRGFRLEVARFLLDLPDGLLNALGVEPSVFADFGLVHNPETVQLSGLTFRSDALWAAIARALRTGHATVPTHDANARLRFRARPDSGHLEFSPTGSRPSQWTTLDDPFLSIFYDSPKRRGDGLRRRALDFDLEGLELEAAIRDISSQEELPERVSRRDHYLANSAQWVYAQTTGHLRCGATFDITDLMPVTLDCLARYLRLVPDDTGLEKPAHRLLQCLGLAETIVRLSHLPVPLADGVVRAFRDLATDRQDSLLLELESRLVAPLERLHLVAILCLPAATNTDRLSRARKHLEWLTASQGGFSEGAAMLAAVRWAHERVGWRSEARGWSAFARFAVAWSHGVALHAAFQRGGADAGNVGEFLRSNTHGLFADFFTLSAEVLQDAANPVRLGWFTLLLKGVACGLGGLSDEQLAQMDIRGLLEGAIGRAQPAELKDLWADRSLGPNPLGSFLGSECAEALVRLGGADFAVQRLAARPYQEVEAAVHGVESQPDNLASLKVFSVVVGERPFYAQLRERLVGRVQLGDCRAEFEKDRKACLERLLLTAELALSLVDSGLREAVWRECLSLAGHLGQAKPCGAPVPDFLRDLAGSLSWIALRLSASRESPEAGFDRFCDKLETIAKAWPAFARYYGLELSEGLERTPLGCSGRNARLRITFRALL